MMDAILSADPKRRELGDKILKNVGEQIKGHKLNTRPASNKSSLLHKWETISPKLPTYFDKEEKSELRKYKKVNKAGRGMRGYKSM